MKTTQAVVKDQCWCGNCLAVNAVTAEWTYRVCVARNNGKPVLARMIRWRGQEKQVFNTEAGWLPLERWRTFDLEREVFEVIE